MPDTERIQVVLPKGLAGTLRKAVPARQRSAFIAGALEDKLRAAERQKAIDDAFGAWSDEDYPYLNTEEDISAWREAIWAGADPDEVLRKRYEERGITSKADLATYRAAYREGKDPEAAVRDQRASRTKKRTRRTG